MLNITVSDIKNILINTGHKAEAFFIENNLYDQKKEIKKLKEKAIKKENKIKNKNIQIKELSAKIYGDNKELHARIDLLELMIKKTGLYDLYCDGCYEYHFGDRQSFLIKLDHELINFDKKNVVCVI